MCLKSFVFCDIAKSNTQARLKTDFFENNFSFLNKNPNKDTFLEFQFTKNTIKM